GVEVVTRQLLERRDIRQFRITPHPYLDQDVNLLVGKPLRPRRLPGGPGIRAPAADLAAFHREIDVVAARIAGDDLEFGADERVERVGIEIRAAGDSRGAHHQLALHHVPDRADAGRVPGIELMTFGESVVLPIQLNWRTSYLTPEAPVA